MLSPANHLFEHWICSDGYFDDLAVFGVGPLHPGGLEATRELLTSRQWEGREVLDIGAGNGTTMRLIDMMGGLPIGVEPSPYMREAARQGGISPDRILPIPAEALELGPRQFQVILLEGVVGFLAQPISLLAYLAEHVDDCGEIVVCDWMPHERVSSDEYGFCLTGQFRLSEAITIFESMDFKCTLSERDVVSRAFSLDSREALRRAEVFFGLPSARDKHLASVVHRKVMRMRAALPHDIATTRFTLSVARC